MTFSAELFNKVLLISNKLRNNNLKISFAESCTGGLLSAIFTEIPNASNIFESSFVTYSNKSKIELLNVKPSTINKYGAVSSQCASEMAIGLLNYNYCDIAISITGIAGPISDNSNKEIGLVYICLITKDKQYNKELKLGNLSRSQIRIKTAIEIINLLNNIISPNN